MCKKRMELYKNGVLMDTDSAAPWTGTIDFNGDAAGKDYTIMAKTYDAAGWCHLGGERLLLQGLGARCGFFLLAQVGSHSVFGSIGNS
jgi:hypothetical protein